MKRLIVGLLLGLLGTPRAQAQQEVLTAPHTATAQQQRQVQLDRALAAFRTGSTHDGLILMEKLYQADSDNPDLVRMYRLNAVRFAMRIAEDCDLDGRYSNCDTALKFINLARSLGDSTVYHEVRAMALYQKLQYLEVAEFNQHRATMPTRLLTKDMAYRYIPEERKIFFKDLINQTTAEVAVARGDLDRKDKLNELSAKLKVIERSQRMIGTR